ncbi:LysR family transcriptional regulator [uncultured Cloacibacillus sp.]|uniref:LysR family transcriptional regulator n=1 Tax=uncultured Cloacibacillus sp. TaxID=889794 RepID=UPI0035A679D2
MDIKQLKRFLDLYETGSFTKTAENLFLSQQALSSSIITLERELSWGALSLSARPTASCLRRREIFCATCLSLW